ncbi:DoxX family protein [Novipirellula artificiosorum]|uniref:DoxX family protein n=1 Tax=Novipirellula artificiosorum TaxID=2528016 RepID=UPI0011B78594|nr:DoxX family protein [Novipirellula artificiosorum]
MRKQLLVPLRLAVGWELSPRLLSIIGATMLVLLRLTIGWHFYTEGIEKYAAGNWTAAPFFVNAKGPFAEEFRGMVWDHDGSIRLDKDAIMLQWATDRDRVADHFGFDDEQRQQAQENYAKSVIQYESVLEENATDLEEYQLGKARMEKLDQDPTRDGVASLGGQRETIRKEWKGKAAPTLKQVDTVWKNYIIAQNSVASREQMETHGAYHLRKPLSALMDTSIIDVILPYFDIAVGLCLLLGLFTPVAGLAAAGFLGSVVLSQFPPATGPTSSIYQLIEAMGCLVLAGTGAGRFAGLDYFLHLIVRKVWGTPSDDEV